MRREWRWRPPNRLHETCRVRIFLIALRAISALRTVRTSRGVIRFAHPSARTELRALLRYARFLQRLRSDVAVRTAGFVATKKGARGRPFLKRVTTGFIPRRHSLRYRCLSRPAVRSRRSAPGWGRYRRQRLARHSPETAAQQFSTCRLPPSSAALPARQE